MSLRLESFVGRSSELVVNTHYTVLRTLTEAHAVERTLRVFENHLHLGTSNEQQMGKLDMGESAIQLISKWWKCILWLLFSPRFDFYLFRVRRIVVQVLPMRSVSTQLIVLIKIHRKLWASRTYIEEQFVQFRTEFSLYPNTLWRFSNAFSGWLGFQNIARPKRKQKDEYLMAENIGIQPKMAVVKIRKYCPSKPKWAKWNIQPVRTCVTRKTMIWNWNLNCARMKKPQKM